jgi:hypothetical protein
VRLDAIIPNVVMSSPALYQHQPLASKRERLAPAKKKQYLGFT